MQLKVCGIINSETIRALIPLAVSRMGFIFYHKSPRYVYGQLIEEGLSEIPAHIKKTGVFVNAEITEIEQVTQRFQLDTIQLHGDESPDFCNYFKGKIEVIKAIPVKDEHSFEITHDYMDSCDLFLFDTFTEKFGGTGRTFDWQWLQAYKEEKPFYLSGGISLENYNEIKSIRHPKLAGIDINSRFETAPGIKDIERIKRLIAMMNA